MNTEHFKEYMRSQGFRPVTCGEASRYAERFANWLDAEGLTAQSCSYTDLLSIVKKYRDEGQSPQNLRKHVRGIWHYYEYQKAQGNVSSNLAENLKIRGVVARLPSDILNRKQMETIFEESQPQTPVQKRNKTILSFLIYQGLMLCDLENLEPSDINLPKGIVTIRGNAKTKRRTLKLEAPQVLLLQEYITTVRPQLEQQKKQTGDKLFISIGTGSRMKEAIKDYLNELKPKYPYLKNFMQLRVSVISQWVKEKPLREVQYLAGHGSIQSTQRYVQASLDELQMQLKLFHPLR
jgi:integrase/recombinase XerD